MERLDITLYEGADFAAELAEAPQGGATYTAFLYSRYGLKLVDLVVDVSGSNVALSLPRSAVDGLPKPANITPHEFSVFYGRWFVNKNDGTAITRIAQGSVRYAPYARSLSSYY